MKRKYTGFYFVLPGFAGVLLFYLVPFLDVMRRSVCAALGDGFVGLANYRTVLTNEAFQLAAKNTGRFLLTCIPCLLALSLLVALGIRELCRLTWLKNLYLIPFVIPSAATVLLWQLLLIPCLLALSLLVALGIRELCRLTWLKNLYLIPFVIPSAATVLLWQLLLDSRGALNGILEGITEPVDWMNSSAAFGVLVCCYIWKNLGYHVVLWLAGLGALNGILAGITEPVDWMNSSTAFGVLVCCYIWKNLGYHVVLWLAGLHAVPKEILEAAAMDGAGRRELLFHILLPYLRPVTFMIVVIAIVNSFKVFREAWMLAGSYPQENIYLLQHLFNNWFLELSMDKLAAGAMLLALTAAGIIGMLWAGSYPQENIYLLQHLFNNWFLELSMDKLAAGAMLLALTAAGIIGMLWKFWDKEERS